MPRGWMVMARITVPVRAKLQALLTCAVLCAGAPALRASESTQGAEITVAGQERALDPLLADLEERTFRFFWDTANPKNGLIPDRYPTPSQSSIAAVGFGLTAYPIGVERGYVSRADARKRVLATLRFFARVQNEHGFFYHFMDMRTGARAMNSEVSTVDTSLAARRDALLPVLFRRCRPREVEIRKLVEKIYRRVDWTWAQPRPPALALAWTPEAGFSGTTGAATTRQCSFICWRSARHRTRSRRRRGISGQLTYDKHWTSVYDQAYLGFAPLFGHQYTHVWVDFRGIRTRTCVSTPRLFREQPARDLCPAPLCHREPAALAGLWQERMGHERIRRPRGRAGHCIKARAAPFLDYAARGLAPGTHR